MGTRRHRTYRGAWGLLAALILAACSHGHSAASVTSTPPSGPAAVTTTTTTVGPTTTVATTTTTVATTTTTVTTTTTTAATTTTAGPTTTGATTTLAPSPSPSTTTGPSVVPGVVVPYVVCGVRDFFIKSRVDVVVFGYDTNAGRPFPIWAGPDNQVSGGAEGDDPLLPQWFTPGNRRTAFLVPTGSWPVVWSVRSPDGRRRSARADMDDRGVATSGSRVLPDCTTADMPGAADQRTPLLTVTSTPLTNGAAIVGVTYHFQASGVDGLSVCPSGMTPHPINVWLRWANAKGEPADYGDIDATNVTKGTDLDLTVMFDQASHNHAGIPMVSAGAELWATEVCEYRGHVVQLWPETVAFQNARTLVYSPLVLTGTPPNQQLVRGTDVGRTGSGVRTRGEPPPP